MNYPISLMSDPNYLLIGTSALFGLIVIIIIYYIFINKKSYGGNNLYSQNVYQQGNQWDSGASGNAYPTNVNGVLPGSISSGGYYAPANAPAPTPMPTPGPTINSTPQVFNIKNNIYTLDDAPAVCGAFGGDVATIDQLIAAHKGGADWCNVGWTKDGIAAYPIQYSTWKTLQEDAPEKRGMCGTPGINVVRNDPNLLYGVNCYGVKPAPKGNEKVRQTLISDKQLAINAQIALLQKNMNSIGVSPFNQGNWSM